MLQNAVVSAKKDTKVCWPMGVMVEITNQDFRMRILKYHLMKERSLQEWGKLSEEVTLNTANMESISRISSMLDTGLIRELNDSGRADSDLSTRVDIGRSWFCKDCQFSSFNKGLTFCPDEEAAGQPQ